MKTASLMAFITAIIFNSLSFAGNESSNIILNISEPAVSYFFDDFENGLENWLVSGQDWDTVSVSYSSDSHSVHSNPGGNYPPYANAGITMANTLDLSSGITPVLTFWHKFQVENNRDYCRVEISDDYGLNWIEIKTFTGTINTWNPVQLDLSAYKTSPIKVRFRLTSEGDHEYYGWFVDDVEIKELNKDLTPFPFADDFESGLGNWLVCAQEWDTTSSSYSSKNHSATDSPDGLFPSWADSKLTLLNSIDLSAANTPVLTFWHKFQVESNRDYCSVEISEDYGFTWTQVTYFTASNNTWSPIQLDLSPYKSETIKIRFRLTSEGDHQYYGWFVDDVEIKEFNKDLNAFPFADDFESGPGNWLVCAQEWDTTSSSYSNKNHSMTDSPDGNFPAWANSILTMLNSVDLSSTNAPVLTFWHKFQVESNRDYCSVEISEDYGFTWTQITYFTGSNNTWSPIQLDLSPYKSATIKIRFRLTSEGDHQYYGWFVDEIEIKELNTDLITFPFFDDFENGLDNWLVCAQEWDTISTDHSSPRHSVSASPLGIYPAWSNAILTLNNSIDLAKTNLPVLIFWHKFQSESNRDYCLVEVSEDYGFSWLQISSFSGTNNTWNMVQLDFSSYKSSPIKLRFRLTSEGDHQYFGWLIDDVEIKDLNPNAIRIIQTAEIPKTYSLDQNYPNPFNPNTTIRFGLPQPGKVSLEVYNSLGQIVDVLLNTEKPAGYHEVQFDRASLASGIYFYKIEAESFIQIKKMLLIK